MITAQQKLSISVLAAIALVLCSGNAFAATVGTVDPSNAANHYAAFVHAPTGQSGSERINFGKFTAASTNNITISGGSLHGYAWSPIAGWIVMNCANTASGCSSANQNFKVAVDGSGTLSGYAWGQQTGWINFGPFANNSTPQIKIAANGNFAGTSGTAGYAWSQKYGWIVFDCANAATCVTTDYGVAAAAPSSGTTTGGNGILSGGGLPPSATGGIQEVLPSAPPDAFPVVPPDAVPPSGNVPVPQQPSYSGTTATASGTISSGSLPTQPSSSTVIEGPKPIDARPKPKPVSEKLQHVKTGSSISWPQTLIAFLIKILRSALTFPGIVINAVSKIF